MESITDYFYQGIKSPQGQKIGLELELFLFHRESLRRVAYEDSPGIPDILSHFIQLEWNPTHEKGYLTAELPHWGR